MHKKSNPVLEAIAAQSAQLYNVQIELTRICPGCDQDSAYTFQKFETTSDPFDEQLAAGFICTACDHFETLESCYQEYLANE